MPVLSPASSSTPLQRELRTYERERARLLGSAAGQWVLITGEQVIATFESQRDAIATGYRELGNVPFLVKEIVAVETPESFVSNHIGF
jgi:hypothetical protein